MAQIRETLTLEDRFSATFTRFLQLGEKAAGASQRAANANQNYQTVLNRMDQQLITLNAQFASAAQEQNAMLAAGQRNSSAFAALDARMERLGGTIRDLTRQYDLVEKEADQAAAAAKRFDSQNGKVNASASSLTGTLGRLAGTFLGMQSVKWLVNTSDQLTQTNARLKLMTGSAEAAAEANDQIYAAAMRSRGAYADMADTVAKLGTLAPNAFTDTGEIIAFAEQLQKQMALSGTSTQGAQAAMLQLTQGLASGVLRGEELNSILEQTPMIAQTIAEYMGVTTGEMRELASEGAVTAEVVKNAMLDAAQETNAAFEQMPMTWSQVWTQFQNIALRALNPILTGINWLANNFDALIPILAAVTGGAIALAAGLGIQAAATWIATGAAQMFFATLLANPLTWIVLLIGLVVGAIAKWVQSVGGLKVAWLTAMDAIKTWWENTTLSIQTGVYNVANWLDEMSLRFSVVSNNIQTFIGAMKVGVLAHLQNMVNGAIDLLNWFIEQVNKIPGVAIETIDHVTFAASAAAEEKAAAAARNADIAAKQQEILENRIRRENELQQMRINNTANQIARNQEITAARADAASGESSPWNATAYDDLLSDTNSIAGDVSSINKSVNMADEDLKNLVDMAERQYVNQINLTAQTPVVTINGANTGNTEEDRRRLGDTIRDIILEQAAAGSYRSTARAYSGG